MASNRAQILISAVDQTKTAFDSIKRGLGGLTDTAKSVNGEARRDIRAAFCAIK